MDCLNSLNTLSAGKVSSESSRRHECEASSEVVAAHRQLHGFLLSEAALLNRERRGSLLTGAAALDKLVQKCRAGPYSRVISDNVPQVSLLADALDEPDTEAFVNLLNALDPCERSFYEAEDHVVDINDKSDILFQEIQTHYGFDGGNRDEYRKYFNRQNLPKGYWVYKRRHETKAISGFSAVGKKDKIHQRKLLMACATNYAWRDVRLRFDHGLLGAGAIGSLHVPSDAWEVDAFDESNALSFLRTLSGCGLGSLCRRCLPLSCLTSFRLLSARPCAMMNGFTRATPGWRWALPMRRTCS